MELLQEAWSLLRRLWVILQWGNGVAAGFIAALALVVVVIAVFRQRTLGALNDYFEKSIERLLLAKQGLESLREEEGVFHGKKGKQWMYRGYMVWEIPGLVSAEECDALAAAEEAPDRSKKEKVLTKLLTRYAGTEGGTAAAVAALEPVRYERLSGLAAGSESGLDWTPSGGHREATLLVFLNGEHEAAVEFPEMDLTVEAEKGKGLFFLHTDYRGLPLIESVWKQKAPGEGKESVLAVAGLRGGLPAAAASAPLVPAQTSPKEAAEGTVSASKKDDHSTEETMSERGRD